MTPRVPWPFVVVARVIEQSGDIREGTSCCTPIKIEATEGQITLCSENFLRDVLHRLRNARPLVRPSCKVEEVARTKKIQEDEQTSDFGTPRCIRDGGART